MDRGPLFLLYLVIAPFVWLAGVFGEKMETGNGCVGGCLAFIGGLFKGILVLAAGYAAIILLCVVVPPLGGPAVGFGVVIVTHIVLTVIAIAKGV